MQTSWESELAGLLTELSSMQGDLLDLLGRKRKCLVASDVAGMQELAEREQAMIARLEACYQRRADLLSRASEQGLPSDSIRSLASSLPGPERKELTGQVEDARRRTRLLQNQSLVNWVVSQRTLLHLAQLLEIIPTGGRQRPTYGKSEAENPHGSLVDQAA